MGACGATTDEPDSAFRWHGTRESSDGVETVLNAGPVLQSEEVTVVESWTTPSAADEHRLNVWEAPASVRSRADGLVVLDRMASRVYAITHGGRWMRTFGGPGGGPGEFGRPEALVVSEDAVTVLDGANSSLNFFHYDGRFLDRIYVHGVVLDLLQLTTDRFLVYLLQGRNATWRTVDGEGQVRGWSFPESDGHASDDPCWRTFRSGRGEVGRVKCSVPVVELLDSAGAVRRRISVDRAPERASEQELRQIEQRIREAVAEVGYQPAQFEDVVARQLESFEVKESVRAVRWDESGGTYAVWIQAPEEFGPDNAEIVLLSSTGVFAASIEFRSSWVDFDVRDHHIYALVRDESTGLVRARAYRLSYPEGFLSWLNSN